MVRQDSSVHERPSVEIARASARPQWGTETPEINDTVRGPLTAVRGSLTGYFGQRATQENGVRASGTGKHDATV